MKFQHQYEEWDRENQRILRRMRILKFYAFGMIAWLFAVIIFSIGTIFFGVHQHFLDGILFVGNAMVCLFIISTLERQTPTKLKWVLIGLLVLNFGWIVTFLCQYVL